MLVVISSKKPGISKIYHLYDQLMISVDFCMIQTPVVDFQYKISSLMTILGFISFHYNFKVNIFCVLIAQMLISIIGAFLYEDEHVIVNFFVNVAIIMTIIVPASILINHSLIKYS